MKPKFSEKRLDVILLQERISRTAKRSLRTALRCRRITPFSVGVRPIPDGSVVVNFGAMEYPPWHQSSFKYLNTPEAIGKSSNKLRTFELLKAAEIPTVRWATDAATVKGWLDKDYKALARLNLSSSAGRGIRVLGKGGDIPEAPLYTRYFPKTHEFRVHVVDGVAIDLTEKKLREDHKQDRAKVALIRSHDNGWVHAHEQLSVTDDADLVALRKLGTSAVLAVGLDFGCADILAVVGPSTDGGVRRLKRAVVCEVNAAPGIENTVTRKAYCAALNILITKRKVSGTI